MSRFPRDNEAGFTLAELTVAMTLGLVFLGIVYTVLSAGSAGARHVDENARASRQAGKAMHSISKFVREMETMYSPAGNYTLKYTADRDDDGVLETVTYSIDGQNRLIETVAEMAGGTPTTRVLAEHVRNAQLGVPMFRYWATQSREATPNAMGFDGDRLSGTKMMTLTIVTDVDTANRPPAYRVTTDVTLRNALY